MFYATSHYNGASQNSTLRNFVFPGPIITRLGEIVRRKYENLGINIFYQKIFSPMCSGRCLLTHIKNFKVNSPRKTGENCWN